MLNASCSSQDRVLLIFSIISCEMVWKERKIRTADAQLLLCTQWLKITPGFAVKYSHMQLHHSHLFFPVVKSLSAHSSLCIMEALTLSKYSQCLPLTCWPRVVAGGFCLVLSSCSRTCLLPCRRGSREVLHCELLEMPHSSREGNNETTQHCWENSAKCCENTAGNNQPAGVKVQLHGNNVQGFCDLAVENGSGRPFLEIKTLPILQG